MKASYSGPSTAKIIISSVSALDFSWPCRHGLCSDRILSPGSQLYQRPAANPAKSLRKVSRRRSTNNSELLWIIPTWLLIHRFILEIILNSVSQFPLLEAFGGETLLQCLSVNNEKHMCPNNKHLILPLFYKWDEGFFFCRTCWVCYCDAFLLLSVVAVNEIVLLWFSTLWKTDINKTIHLGFIRNHWNVNIYNASTLHYFVFKKIQYSNRSEI